MVFVRSVDPITHLESFHNEKTHRSLFRVHGSSLESRLVRDGRYDVDGDEVSGVLAKLCESTNPGALSSARGSPTCPPFAPGLTAG